ncbi:MAG TPA: YbhN family protein [Acidimicrobiia bacterium]
MGSMNTDATVPLDDLPAAPERSSSLVRKLIQVAVSLVVLVAIFWYVFKQVADVSEVWAAVRTLTWRENAFLALITVVNLLSYWVVLVIATPGLGFVQASVLTQSTTAIANSVPAGGGIALGLTYSILSSWGFSRSRATVSIVITGIWNNFVKLGTPILALAILALHGQPGGGKLLAALAGLAGLVGAIVVFALILRNEAFAAKVGTGAGRWASSLLRAFGRGPVTGWDRAVVKFRNRVVGLVRLRWVSLTVSTIASHAALYAVLVTALRVMGVSDAEVGWAQVLAIFAFARLLTAIPLTPGGVGVIELALIAGLTRAGGDSATVVAAVLLFRALTYVLPILFGAFAYMYWRRNRSWRGTAPPLPPELSAAVEA